MTYQDRLTSPGPARDDPGAPDATQAFPVPPPPGASPPSGSSGNEGPSATDRAREAADTGREQAREVATTAQDQARHVAGTARDEARDVARTAEGQARRLAGDAREELRSQADGQVGRLADGLGQLSRQLSSMGDGAEDGPLSDLTYEAAFRAQQAADRLRQGGVDDAVNQLKSLGRNRPGLFLLGAFGAGLLAGRVARNLAQAPSSSEDGDRRALGGDPELGAESPALSGAYTERYEVPASATGVIPPGPAGDPGWEA